MEKISIIIDIVSTVLTLVGIFVAIYELRKNFRFKLKIDCKTGAVGDYSAIMANYNQETQNQGTSRFAFIATVKNESTFNCDRETVSLSFRVNKNISSEKMSITFPEFSFPGKLYTLNARSGLTTVYEINQGILDFIYTHDINDNDLIYCVVESPIKRIEYKLPFTVFELSRQYEIYLKRFKEDDITTNTKN